MRVGSKNLNNKIKRPKSLKSPKSLKNERKLKVQKQINNITHLKTSH